MSKAEILSAPREQNTPIKHGAASPQGRKKWSPLTRQPSHKKLENGTKFLVSTAGDSSVLTKKGFIPIGELAGERVEVWTGAEWCPAQVSAAAHKHTQYVVETTGGFKMTSAGNQTWAVLGEGQSIRAKLTKSLSPGDTLFPYLFPWMLENTEVGPETAAKIRRMGQKAAPAGKISSAIYKQIHLAPPALCLQFIMGWMDVQGGRLIVPSESAQDLIMVLLRAGIGPCHVIQNGPTSEVYIHRKFKKVFAPLDDLSPIFVDNVPPLKIVNVRTKASAHCYHLCLHDGASGSHRQPAQSVVIDTALVLTPHCKTASSRADESQSSGDEACGGCCSDRESSPATSPVKFTESASEPRRGQKASYFAEGSATSFV